MLLLLAASAKSIALFLYPRLYLCFWLNLNKSIEGFILAIVTMLLPYSDAITRTQDTGDPAIIPGYL